MRLLYIGDSMITINNNQRAAIMTALIIGESAAEFELKHNKDNNEAEQRIDDLEIILKYITSAISILDAVEVVD
jgi:hypothetical protein